MQEINNKEQIIAAVMKKDDASQTLKYVYLVSDLVKHFSADKVKQWNARISKGAKAFFKFNGKVATKFGVGYKFSAEWHKQ